jgi:Mg-chelatase subunit ChlD
MQAHIKSNMKSKVLALVLFAATAAAVAVYPLLQNTTTGGISGNLPLPPELSRRQIEVVFVLDTTGSMGGLIQAAKEKIWAITSSMAAAQPAPLIKLGLVAYRDRGDQYVTQVVDLSEDLDSVYATLMDFTADGGGDGPESVNQALYDAVHSISWSGGQDVYKVVFLVGDAPPHMDYVDDVKYPHSIAAAQQKGIIVNSVQCGEDGETAGSWRQIAQLGRGEYFSVGQNGSAIAINTPFDAQIATLSRELDDTRLYYGNAEDQVKQQAKLAATGKLHEESSPAALARRGAFNASKSGGANFLGEGELVDAVTNGGVELASIKPEHLPAPLQSMTPVQRETLIQDSAKKRELLTGQMQSLAEQRQRYLKDKVAAQGGAGDSLDEQIYRTLRTQAEQKGLKYDAAATPAY